VPVYTPTFDLQSLTTALPSELGRKVSGYQAVELPHKYFKFAVQQLIEEYLVARAIDVAPTPARDTTDLARIQAAAAPARPVTAERMTAQQYLERALIAAESGDVDGAITDLDEAIRLNPQFAWAFNNRGFARWKKGDVDGAITDYDEAIRLNTGSVLP